MISCCTCDRESEFPDVPPTESIASDQYWRVAHATSSSLAGWLILVPRRHVMEVADLSSSEIDVLGQWQVRVSRALRDELGVRKTYVVSFGEAPGFHLHFHVIPRPNDLPANRRGPNVFQLLAAGNTPQISTAERDDICRRLAGRLGGNPA